LPFKTQWVQSLTRARANHHDNDHGADNGHNQRSEAANPIGIESKHPRAYRLLLTEYKFGHSSRDERPLMAPSMIRPSLSVCRAVGMIALNAIAIHTIASQKSTQAD
jgi:hypothetical protein